MSFAKIIVCVVKRCFVSGRYVGDNIADFRKKYCNLFLLVLSITYCNSSVPLSMFASHEISFLYFLLKNREYYLLDRHGVGFEWSFNSAMEM